MTTGTRVDWTGWENLAPKRLKKRFSERLRLGATNNDLIALYNLLINHAAIDPRAVAAQADAIVAVLKAGRYNFGLSTFMELGVRARIGSRDLLDALAILERMVPLARGPQEHADLIELTDDVWFGAAQPPFPEDAAPRILASMSRVFRALNDLDRLTKVLLTASALYADHGAIPAARRAAQDAAKVAQDAENLTQLAQAFEEMAILAYRDKAFEDVLETGEAATRIHEARGDPAPPWLLNTIATALMHLDRDGEAMTTYEAALETSRDDQISASLSMNMAACLRKRGELDGALAAIARARSLLPADANHEAKLELELIGSRIASAAGNAPDAVSCLGRAADHMSQTLAPVLRLHRRRMVRDRYVVRFEAALRDLAPEGPVEDVAAALATVRGTVLADWLSLLAWADQAARDPMVKGELSRCLEQIEAFGAPYLYGFREKYDDPWEPIDYAAPWDNLSDLIGRLRSPGDVAPYDFAATPAAADLIRTRLREGYAIAIPTFGGGPMRLWFLSADRYRCIDISASDTSDFIISRAQYQNNEIDGLTFARKLYAVVTSIKATMAPILDELVASERKGLIYCQDALESVPISALMVGHDAIRERMATGDFEFRLAPAIYPAGPQAPLTTPSILSIIDSAETDLGLAPFEAGLCAEVLNASLLSVIEADDHDGFASKVGAADVVVVSTHGSPISRYRDPIFASMSVGKKTHVINVDALQRTMPSTRFSLVLLNACHSGVGTNKNIYSRPRTYDLASYPSLMLLNGVAAVSATSWKVSDTASFCFAVLVSRLIGEGETPTRALSRGIALLRDMTKSEVIELVGKVPDKDVVGRMLGKIGSAPEKGMFSVPYMSGSLQTVTLM